MIEVNTVTNVSNAAYSSSKDDFMITQAKYLRRDPAEIKPWAETCGQIRFLIENKDGAGG